MRVEWISAGRIVNAHGVRGEVRILPGSAGPELLTRCKTLYMDAQALSPSACRIHKGAVVARLPGVDSRDAALALKGRELYVRRADVTLPAGQYFDEELLGMTVCDCESGAPLGTITAVADYPAGKLYTVRGERELLVPAVPEAFIRSVDLDANRMEIKVWEGL